MFERFTDRAPTGDFDSAAWPSALGEERWLLPPPLRRSNPSTFFWRCWATSICCDGRESIHN